MNQRIRKANKSRVTLKLAKANKAVTNRKTAMNTRVTPNTNNSGKR